MRGNSLAEAAKKAAQEARSYVQNGLSNNDKKPTPTPSADNKTSDTKDSDAIATETQKAAAAPTKKSVADRVVNFLSAAAMANQNNEEKDGKKNYMTATQAYQNWGNKLATQLKSMAANLMTAKTPSPKPTTTDSDDTKKDAGSEQSSQDNSNSSSTSTPSPKSTSSGSGEEDYMTARKAYQNWGGKAADKAKSLFSSLTSSKTSTDENKDTSAEQSSSEKSTSSSAPTPQPTPSATSDNDKDGPNAYQALGVKPDATQPEITEAFNAKMLSTNDPKAQQGFMKAADSLSPDKREEYDSSNDLSATKSSTPTPSPH